MLNQFAVQFINAIFPFAANKQAWASRRIKGR